jgi:SAM-dependent methyltransferase
MNFKDHFSKLAAQYSAFRPQYPAALFDYLAGLCDERRLVWDCACGNGQATGALADRFDSVIGTDASAQQIAAAQPHPNVVYRVASAENSGLEPLSVNMVTVAQALHWFDLDAFYREVNRVLRVWGILAVWTYATMQVDGAGIDSLVQEFYHHIVGPYWPPERRHTERGNLDLPFPYAELAPPQFLMEEHWDLSRLAGYLRTWSATGRYVAQHGVDPVVALEGRLASAWDDPGSTRRVTWPLAVRAGRKP